MKSRGVLLINLVVAAVLIGLLAGCQTSTKISWDPMEKASGQARDVAASSLASYAKKPATVGRHTVTLFAIPAVPIKSSNRIDEAVGQAVVDALKAANYNVQLMDKPPTDRPYLTGNVEKFRYWSYMWLWPLMIEGGGIRYQLNIKNPQGESVWTSSFKASSGTPMFGGAFGYDGLIRRAMTKLANQVKQAALTPEFQKALGK